MNIFRISSNDKYYFEKYRNIGKFLQASIMFLLFNNISSCASKIYPRFISTSFIKISFNFFPLNENALFILRTLQDILLHIYKIQISNFLRKFFSSIFVCLHFCTNVNFIFHPVRNFVVSS